MVDWGFIITSSALIFSEILPFIDKNKGGISYWLFFSLYKSGCFTDEQKNKIEEVLDMDIDGDGKIGEEDIEA